MPDDLLSALDKFVLEHPDKLSRPLGIRLILQDWFIAHGYMKPEPELDVIEGGAAAQPAKRRRSRHQETGD